MTTVKYSQYTLSERHADHNDNNSPITPTMQIIHDENARNLTVTGKSSPNSRAEVNVRQSYVLLSGEDG